MYQKFTWQTLNDIFVKMYHKTNDGGRVFVFANRDGLFNTMNGLKNAGFNFLNILIWDKQHFGGGYHFRRQEEYIVYVSKGKPKTYVKGISNIFNYKRPSKNDAVPSIGYNPIGVSAKPQQIWRDIITHGGCQDDVCADPFAGTNPMRAALLLNQTLLNKIKEAHTNVYLT
jgi:DNA modification methylase